MDSAAKDRLRSAFWGEQEAPPQDSLSAQEWAELLGVSIETFGKLRRNMMRKGRMAIERIDRRQAPDGIRISLTPLYQLIDPT